MNKALLSTAICIVILSAVGIVYSASNPAVDYCAAPNPGGLGPAVCVYRESTNWIGLGVAMDALILGAALTIYGSKWQKMRNRDSEKKVVTEIMLTAVAIISTGLGLFYSVYSLVLVPLGMRNDIAVITLSCMGLSALVAWLRVKSLLAVQAK